MSNKEIAQHFRLTAALMELHDSNAFKIRPYSNAAIILDNMKEPVANIQTEELQSVDGIGKSIAAAIRELIDTGTFEHLDRLIRETPEGILEMVNMKGIGPKKIKTLWREYNIENIEQLLVACEKGQVAQMKGFGEKTQDNIQKVIAFQLASRGKIFYADAWKMAENLMRDIERQLPQSQSSPVGDLRRKIEVIENMEVLVGIEDFIPARSFFDAYEQIDIDPRRSGPFCLRGIWKGQQIGIDLHLCKPEDFHRKLFLLTGSAAHFQLLSALKPESLFHYNIEKVKHEEDIYDSLDLAFIPPELREGTFEVDMSQSAQLPVLLEMSDLKGSFHNHSTYSDGKNTIREMAQKCIDSGYQYLGMADHSKSAFYASGLQEFQVAQQHEEIDRLNDELAPFKIFKGIESDILNDGSLDYDDSILATFDFIVASIHSNLNMDKTKAMTRLLRAIENPYTTFLGHPTGRLLLSRAGYPVDHKVLIDACAKNKVIIEINANPWRLDLDWRWVHYALDQGVMLSINPDAHEIDGIDDMYFGVCVGRKGGLSKKETFNAMGLKDVEKYLAERKSKIR